MLIDATSPATEEDCLPHKHSRTSPCGLHSTHFIPKKSQNVKVTPQATNKSTKGTQMRKWGNVRWKRTYQENVYYWKTMRLTRSGTRKDGGAAGKDEATVGVASKKKQRNRKEKKKNSKKVIQRVWSPLFIRDQNPRDPKRHVAWKHTPRQRAAWQQPRWKQPTSILWTRIFHVRPHSIGETRFLLVKN